MWARFSLETPWFYSGSLPPQESAERFLADLLAQQASPFGRTRSNRAKFCSQFPQMLEPRLEFRTELALELLPHPLCQRRTPPAGGDCDLQRPAANHRRIVEVAQRRVVHHVAQCAFLPGEAKDLLV